MRLLRNVKMNTKICFVAVILFFVWLISCGEKQAPPNEVADLSSYPFYYFTPGTDQILENAQPFEIEGKIDRKSVIEKLADHLAATYFAQVDSAPTHIRFELVDLKPIHANHRTYYIATINMQDEKEAGYHHFFQGSFGGQATFAMISATFLQPQNNPPLLDGLIFTYNGNAFPKLDHINFNGIITPRVVERVVFSAIQNSISKEVVQQKSDGSD